MVNNINTQKYDVTGMHCASCASIIKRKLGKLPEDVDFFAQEACNRQTDKRQNREDCKKKNININRGELMINTGINKRRYQKPGNKVSKNKTGEQIFFEHYGA